MNAQDNLFDGASRYNKILCEYESGVLWVTFNRTDALNAIDSFMADQLYNIWSSIMTLQEEDTIVISAAGSEAFCIGFDRIGPPQPDVHPDRDEGFSMPITPKEYGLAQRVIVAVNGVTCREAFRFLRDADVVIAARNASFFEPRPRLPEWYAESVTDRRVRAIRAVAAEGSALTDPVTAQRAKEVGLVEEVVSRRWLRDAASRIARGGYRADLCGGPSL